MSSVVDMCVFVCEGGGWWLIVDDGRGGGEGNW